MPSKKSETDVLNKYEVVIGMEVHVQLATQTKMFCRCQVDVDSLPNTKVCPICLGLPGVLPQTNTEAIKLGIKAALALGCKINTDSRWARKHYFSPDLPKGYQITQYEYPLAEKGSLALPGMKKSIRIRRIHLEEDAGKLLHSQEETLVDFNRCGVPLAEIVTEPEIASAEEADGYLKELRLVLRTIGVTDGEMERGHFRCEPNISVRRKGSEELGVRSEIKNLNSFKAVREGIECALQDQIVRLEKGEKITQTTYLWDEKNRKLKPMRYKETAADYRYFPEPDLPELVLDLKEIENIQLHIPQLPSVKRSGYLGSGLSLQDAEILIEEPSWEKYFNDLIENGASFKEASTWLLNEARGIISERKETLSEFKVDASEMSSLIAFLRNGSLSRPAAKELLAKMAETGERVEYLIQKMEIKVVSDEAVLMDAAKQTILENPEPVERYRSGKEGVIGFLLGQCMKKLKGKADPVKVKETLLKYL